VSAVKKRILIVEDDASALGAVRLILAQRGYDVATAASGEEALAILEKASFDLFLLDVVMPGMSGYELCRLIRKKPETEATPVIFLTGKGLLVDMTEGQNAGSDLYLIKPILATKLVSMVGLFLNPDAPLARRRRPATA
jgi:DNA-binding response OmpR family regulator